MVTPWEKLVESFEKLKAILDQGLVAIKVSDLTEGIEKDWLRMELFIEVK